MNHEIIPSILVDSEEDFRELLEAAEGFADSIQWDIADGQFVETTTFDDPSVLKEIGTHLFVEVHLMVEEPQERFQDLQEAGVDRIIVHAEACDDLEDIVSQLEDMSIKVGVALNPETDIDVLDDVIDRLDSVLVMTVNPGSSGQPFLQQPLEKVAALRTQYPDLNIEVDGGVNETTIVKCRQAGANLFVANSAIFTKPDPEVAFTNLAAQID